MRSVLIVILLLLLLFGFFGFSTLPAQGQGELSPEDQAALDVARAAMAGFLAYDSYTLAVKQDMTQSFFFVEGAESFQMEQVITSEGSLDFQRAPDQPYDNRSLDLTQTILQTMSGRGLPQPEVAEIGPTRTRLIVAEGRLFLRLDVTPDLAGFFPEGWQDVTEGASMFPGMEMTNFQGMLNTGQALSFTYLDTFFSCVTGVESAEPASDLTGAASRQLIALDSACLLEGISVDVLAGMFAQGLEGTMDVNAFIEAMFNNPMAVYALDLTLDDQGTLLAYGEHVVTDADISEALASLEMGAGVTVTLKQDITQTYRIQGFNQPLAITAPELGAE